MYGIYGKLKNSKGRYRPLDLDNLQFVYNKLYMTVFWNESDYPIAEKIVKDLNESNPEYIFKVVKL